MAGTVIAVVTSQVAALVRIVGASALFAMWHDAATQRAIAGSGGLGEVYTLPFLMVVPALILGTIGGAAGSVISRLRPSRKAGA